MSRLITAGFITVILWIVFIPAVLAQEEITTSGAITAEDSFDRVLTKNKQRSVRVELQKGTLYAFDLESSAFDAYLRIEDDQRRTLAENDDSRIVKKPAPGERIHDARVLWVPADTGAFHLVLIAKEGKTGDYVLRARRYSVGKRIHQMPLEVPPGDSSFLVKNRRVIRNGPHVAKVESEAFAPRLLLRLRGQNRALAVGPKQAMMLLPEARTDDYYQFHVDSSQSKAAGKFQFSMEELTPLPFTAADARALGLQSTAALKPISDRLTENDPPNPFSKGARLRNYKVHLEAGKPYLIEASSTAFDVALLLYDGGDMMLAENDDGAPRRAARILFEPLWSGPYQVYVTGGKQGAFTLGVRELQLKPDGPEQVIKGNWTKTDPKDDIGAHLKAQRLKLNAKSWYRAVLHSPDTRVMLQVFDLKGQRGLQGHDAAGLAPHEFQPPVFRRNAQLFFSPEGDGLGNPVDAVAVADKPGATGAFVLRLQEYALTGSSHLRLEHVPDLSKDVRLEVLQELAELNRTINTCHAEQRYGDGVAHARKMLDKMRQIRGEEHPRTIAAISNLALFLTRSGQLQEARRWQELLLRLQGRVYGAEHPLTGAMALVGFGDFLLEQGDDVAARVALEKASTILKRTLGEDHHHVARVYSGLAETLARQTDYANALRYRKQALDIMTRRFGADHPATVTYWSSFGLQLLKTRERALAPDYLDKAYEIYRKHNKNMDPQAAVLLNNIAVALSELDRHADARGKFEAALAINKKVYGEAHPYVAKGLLNLAATHMHEGKAQDSLDLYKQAIQLYMKHIGSKHSASARALGLQGDAYRQLKDQRNALLSYEQAFAIASHNASLAAAGQSTRQQLNMRLSQRSYLYRYVAAAVATKVPAEKIYAHVLDWNGAALMQQRQMRQVRSDPKVAALVAQLEAVSRELSTLALGTPDAKDRERWKRQVADLLDKKDKLEFELATKSQEFRQAKDLKVTPAVLKQHLPPGTVLVDFLVYRHLRPKDLFPKNNEWVTVLTAFIVRADRPVVQVTFDCNMADVRDAIDSWRKGVRQHAPAKNSPAMFLREKLWEPLLPHLKDATTVLISPDADLSRLPFAALPGGKPGSYLIEETRLAVIPVPRLLPALLAEKKDLAGEPELLMIGDVDFDAQPGKVVQSTGIAAQRSGSQANWDRLPGTKAEIASVQEIFARQFKKGALRLASGAEATEALLRSEAPKHRILHLATHGFFNPPASAPDAPESAQESVTGTHPDLLAGLVLAGANRPPQLGQDDGILTALEVADLDLRNVELTVLSACETGLGKVAFGEGLLGLQRAFQAAGVRSVVSSLWSVPDEPTQVMMTRFYNNLWEKKMSRLDALREAQLWMLREGRADLGIQRGLARLAPAERPDSNAPLPPYYWAAFVLSGDWR